ncbi:hypothetical protein INR49_018284 [Caranx melampygus]|nr:hypothetical protein INR49_018284 [Caranx melampygus]
MFPPPDAPKLPSVSVSPSAEIVEGSSVTLTCSSDANPAANYTWYKEDEDSPKASGHIFTITDLRPEHSGNYYCEAQNTRGRHKSTLNLTVVVEGEAPSHSNVQVAGSVMSQLGVALCFLLPGVFMGFFLRRCHRPRPSSPVLRLPAKCFPPSLVTYVKVKVKVNYPTQVECDSSCEPPRPSYIWYKNGQKTSQTRASHSVPFYRADSYSCALRGSKDFPSPSTCVSDAGCNKVTYTDRRVCALRGSSVEISCSYNSNNYDVESKLWFRRGHSQHLVDISGDPQYSGRVEFLEPETRRSTLRITDLTESDSAEYLFKFKARWFDWGSDLPGTTLTVTDVRVEVLWYFSLPKLKCETSCHLRDGVSGESCNSVTYPHRRICAFKGSSVDISCSYSSYHSIQSKFWFRPDSSLYWQNPLDPVDLREDPQYSGRVEFLEPETRRSTLRITDLTESDSAEYRFKFRTGQFDWGSDLPGTTLTVTAVQLQVSRVIGAHQSHAEAKLKCVSSCSPTGLFIFVWFKNGEKVQEETSSSYTSNFGLGDDISCALRGYEDHRSASVCSAKSAAAGSITVLLLLAIIVLSVVLFIRRRRSFKPPCELDRHRTSSHSPSSPTHTFEKTYESPDYENSSGAVQIKPADDILYASVRFTKNPEALYSNIRTTQPITEEKNKDEEDEDESVEYSTVNVKSVDASSRVRREEGVEDPCALYSTVSKKYRV